MLASAPGSLEAPNPGWHAVAFQSERWKSADEFVRFTMLQDLVDNHLRYGMSGTELEALLGPLNEGWSDAVTGHSYVFWVERPREREAYLEYWRGTENVVPRELRNVVGLRLDLEHDRLTRWELIKP
jgi:hypothetical protein